MAPTQQQITGASTADDVVKLYGERAKGKVAIVTGSNTGIGFETARALAAAGAKVFAAARAQAKSEETVAKLKALVPNGDLHPLELELGSLANVRKAAETFLALGLPLNILVLNAGIMANPLAYTKDGIEMQFGVNHIGHFLFSTLLYGKLKETQDVRVVSVSSTGHYLFGQEGILFDDLGANRDVRRYNRWQRYANSKLANVLLAKELQRHFDADGLTNAFAVSLHPGGIGETELARQEGQVGWELVPYLGRIICSIMRDSYALKSIPQGAATSVFCAIAPTLTKGAYYNNSAVATVNINRYNDDPAMAKRLWDVSQSIVDGKQ